MKKKRLIYLLLSVYFLLLSNNGIAQQLQKTSFEQLDSLVSHQPRKTVVLISTMWCKYCNKMKNTTLNNEKVVNLLNDEFYFIEMDAEQKTPIDFKGKSYQYKPTGNNTGMNELVEILGTVDGKISYPTLVILNEKYEIIFQYPGYLASKELQTVLRKI